MLKAPLLGTELETWRSGAREWQRSERDLWVSSHDWSDALKGDIHVLPRHGTPIHQLLNLVTGRLRCGWAGRRHEGRGRGLGRIRVGLLLFSFAAGEGPGPLQLVLDTLRAAAMVHYRPPF